MWLMLQQDKPEDYVIATGVSHSVEELLDAAFKHVDLDYQDYLAIDENLYRPSEVNLLQEDASKARRKLKWAPEISFDGLIKEMVEGDIKWHRK